MSDDPEWLRKAIADGSAKVKGVNPSAFDTPVLDRALSEWNHRAFITLCHVATSEAQLQGHVVDLAHLLGWKVVHIRKVLVKMGEKTHYETPFDIDGVGSFDLDFYRERHFKAELKFGKNKPTPEQREWHKRYCEAGVEAYIWYPSDAEHIIEVLTCRRPKT